MILISFLHILVSAKYTDQYVKKEMIAFIANTIKDELKKSIHEQNLKLRMHHKVMDTIDPRKIDGREPETLTELRMKEQELKSKLNLLKNYQKRKERKFAKMMKRRETLQKLSEYRPNLAYPQIQFPYQQFQQMYPIQ